jgi:hypothetical protein
VVQELDRCRVHGVDGELLADGFVRASEQDVVFVAAQNFTGRLLDPGDEAVLVVLDPDRGEATYDAVVTHVELGLVQLEDLVLRERVQQRAAVRVTTDIRVTVSHLDTGGDAEPLPEPVQATVVDVSAHGVRVMARHGFEVGTRLRLRLGVGREHVDVVALVLRAHEVPGGVAHGCRLVDVPERVSDLLFRFVMEEQRRALAARRGG